MTELDLGQGQGYEGRIVRGTTAFTAVTGAIKQANQGTGTVRGVVETILKFVLPSDLAVYSLTGKSLQERFEVRNGQTQARVIMSESGSSKLCIPPQLVQGEKTFIILKQLFKTVFFLGLATFLKLHLTPAGLAGAGSSLASYTRKLISKSCSRSQEKRNLENKITRTKK